MDAGTTVAAATAFVAAAYLVLGLLADGVRQAARMPLRALPSLRRLAAAGAVLAVLARTAPAGAALPPPPMRLGAVRSPAEPAAGPAVRAAAEVAVLTVPTPGAAYVVERGDSLWTIACRALADAHGGRPSAAEVASFWKHIYAANRDVVGGDPDLIFPGQRLSIPEVG